MDEIAEQKAFKLFLDGIQGAFVLGFAPFFQSYLQGLNFFTRNPNLYGITGDLTYNLAGTAGKSISEFQGPHRRGCWEQGLISSLGTMYILLLAIG